MATPKRIMRVMVDGKTYEADLNRLMWTEAEQIEDKAKASMAEIMQTKSMRSVRALIWVIMKRGDPTLKFEDLASREVGEFDLEQVDEAEEGDGEPDPTVAGTPAWQENESAT